MRLVRLSVIAVCLCASNVFAQFDSATVLGTVRDPAGAVIPGVAITLTNVQTGLAATATTDENGNYEILNVKVGSYRLSAAKAPFSTATVDDVAVTVNAHQRVDFVLQLPAMAQTVEVVGRVSALETDTSARGQVIDRQQVTQLPLNGRAYSDLALLTTGVRRSQIALGTQARDASFNVNGLRSTFNSFLLDGVDNDAYGTSNQGFSNQVIQPSPDALAQFKVETNNMSAEFGRAGGAVVNASTRSGTNQVHGSAWEFIRNTKLNAVGFFKPPGGMKPVLIRNQFGFTFGGPIRRNRTFFFTDFEGFREIQKAVQFSSLPTLDDRQGIMHKPVQNPLTGALYTDGVVPPNLITPFARKVLDDLPPPTGPGRSNNFVTSPRNTNFNHKEDVRIDHQLSERFSIFSRVSNRKVNIFQAPAFPGPSGGGANGNTRVLNQQLSSGFTDTLSPSSLVEFRLGIDRTRGGKSPPFLGAPSALQTYGIPGLPDDPRISGGLLPESIVGFTTAFGRQPTNPQWQYPFVINPKVNYTWILRRHTLKMGYEWQHINIEVVDVNPLYGSDVYDSSFSRPAGQPADPATYNFVDFLFGARSQYSLGNFLDAQMRQRMHFAYVQDDFKVNSKLTLNLGLRYEYATPMWEDSNRLSNYDPATNSIVLAKAGSIEDRSVVKPNRKDFAPRIGFAYSLNSKTVVRSGYGIGYIHVNRVGSNNVLAINGPQFVQALIRQTPSDPGFIPTQQGYPAGLTDPSKFDPLKSTVFALQRNMPDGYVQTWFLSVQRELGWGTVLDVAYVGNHAVKLIMFADLNQARPNNPGENSPLQARRPNPRFSSISAGIPAGWSNYNALQVKLEKRAAGGLYFLNSFTWSKAMDNVCQALEDLGGLCAASPQDIHNLQADKSVSSYDQPVTNVTSLVWQMPVGKGRRWGSGMPALAEGFLGSWELSAINSMWSGIPVNLRYSPSAPFQVTASLPPWEGGAAFRPNIIGDPLTPESQRSVDNYLNRNTVVVPTDPSQPFGNAGRNIARSPSFYQLDFAAHKFIRLPREETSLEFRAEFFNLLNKTNFGVPDGNRSNASFGTIRSTFDPRQIQFSLKLHF